MRSLIMAAVCAAAAVAATTEPPRKIVGWRVSTSMSTQFVFDALDQAIFQRKSHGNNALIHHSDRGSQYLSITYTERLAEADIDPSVGTVGDSYDNALAESVIGLFKTEVINALGPWRTFRDVEWEVSEILSPLALGVPSRAIGKHAVRIFHDGDVGWRIPTRCRNDPHCIP